MQHRIFRRPDGKLDPAKTARYAAKDYAAAAPKDAPKGKDQIWGYKRSVAIVMQNMAPHTAPDATVLEQVGIAWVVR